MNPDKRSLLKWFGYSRRERRSTFILLIILLIVIATRYLVPQKSIEIEDISASFSVSGELAGTMNNDVHDKSKSFSSDPYNTTSENLSGSGLSHQKIKSAGKHQPQPIDLNKCDSAAMEHLPGIGPVLSTRIIKYRKLLGGFASASQLKEVYGLSEETYNLIAEKVTADSMDVKKININRAEFKDLIRYPYINRYDVQSILKYRELKGKITGMGDLIENKLLTIEKAVNIRPYLKFEE
jgi:competence protein ComEA